MHNNLSYLDCWQNYIVDSVPGTLETHLSILLTEPVKPNENRHQRI